MIGQSGESPFPHLFAIAVNVFSSNLRSDIFCEIDFR